MMSRGFHSKSVPLLPFFNPLSEFLKETDVDDFLRVPVDISKFLEAEEEISYESSICCQTDDFWVHDAPEFYKQPKRGLDSSTQLSGWELFNFDRDVEFIVKAAVSKILETALEELEKEQTLKILSHKKELIRDSIEQFNLRLLKIEEKENNKETSAKLLAEIDSKRKQSENETIQKLLTIAVVEKHLSAGKQCQVLKNLEQVGFFIDPVDFVIENVFSPVLKASILENSDDKKISDSYYEVVVEKYLDNMRKVNTLILRDEQKRFNYCQNLELLKRNRITFLLDPDALDPAAKLLPLIRDKEEISILNSRKILKELPMGRSNTFPTQSSQSRKSRKEETLFLSQDSFFNTYEIGRPRTDTLDILEKLRPGKHVFDINNEVSKNSHSAYLNGKTSSKKLIVVGPVKIEENWSLECAVNAISEWMKENVPNLFSYFPYGFQFAWNGKILKKVQEFFECPPVSILLQAVEKPKHARTRLSSEPPSETIRNSELLSDDDSLID